MDTGRDDRWRILEMFSLVGLFLSRSTFRMKHRNVCYLCFRILRKYLSTDSFNFFSPSTITDIIEEYSFLFSLGKSIPRTSD